VNPLGAARCSFLGGCLTAPQCGGRAIRKHISRCEFARQRKGGPLRPLHPHRRVPGRFIARLGDYEVIDSFLVERCGFLLLGVFIWDSP
jgi:hypothetical protein